MSSIMQWQDSFLHKGTELLEVVIEDSTEESTWTLRVYREPQPKDCQLDSINLNACCLGCLPFSDNYILCVLGNLAC